MLRLTLSLIAALSDPDSLYHATLFKEAIAAYEQKQTLTEKEIEQLATCYLANQEPEKAIALFEAGTKHPLLSRSYLATGNFEKALEAAPKDSLIEAVIHLEMGEPKKAEDLLISLPKSPDRDVLLAKTYLALGEHSHAERLLNNLKDDQEVAALKAACTKQKENVLVKRERKAQELLIVFLESKDLMVLEELTNNYPESPFTAEAFFKRYSFQEYTQGDRHAMKHLEQMEKKFPNSPFLIPGYYLIGMDHLRDRSSFSRGRAIRRKSLAEAVRHFQEAEKQFDKVSASLTDEEKTYYKNVVLQAKLERALANLNLSEEGGLAKKEVTLGYAEELFSQLAKVKSLEAESSFYLAKIKALKGDKPGAIALYGKLTDPNWQGQAYLEKAKLEIALSKFDQAFKSLQTAEKSLDLSKQQNLEVLIAQAEILKQQNQLNEAMLKLSLVINSEVASSLRIKAMLDRAEIYELQSRDELAKKQLESVILKGGEWASEAKKRLENYGS